MADFIEFKGSNDDNVLVNIEHLVKVQSGDDGTYLYLDVTTGNNNSTSLSVVFVAESYSVVKRKLQR